MLQEKYAEVVGLLSKYGVKDSQVAEAGGKLKIKGTTTYQLEKDLIWDKIKSYPNWEAEVAADIRAERDDIHGIHVVQPGDTLSKIAKVHLDDPNRYMEIFKANPDVLTDPNLIKPGQKLTIPKR